MAVGANADARSRLLNVTKLPSRAGSHFPEFGEETTATHFAISVRSANSFGVPPTGSSPCRISAVRICSVFNASLAAPDSFSMIADGIPAGAGSPI
jgi:hypothetical protein